jgi:hypothetical protein
MVQQHPHRKVDEQAYNVIQGGTRSAGYILRCFTRSAVFAMLRQVLSDY